MLPVCACLWFMQELYFAVQHGDWRRGAAALLGRFLPKLRAARKSGLFSWVSRFTEPRGRSASKLMCYCDRQTSREVAAT